MGTHREYPQSILVHLVERIFLTHSEIRFGPYGQQFAGRDWDVSQACDAGQIPEVPGRRTRRLPGCLGTPAILRLSIWAPGVQAAYPAEMF